MDKLHITDPHRKLNVNMNDEEEESIGESEEDSDNNVQDINLSLSEEMNQNEYEISDEENDVSKKTSNITDIRTKNDDERFNDVRNNDYINDDQKDPFMRNSQGNRIEIDNMN